MYNFCVFVAGWRHALQSEWPFISIIIMYNCMAVILRVKQWDAVIQQVIQDLDTGN